MFTRKELLQLHYSLCEKARTLLEQKNQDYAGADQGDPFGNLLDSRVFGVAPEVGVLIRCMDKFKRIVSLLQTGQLCVSDEKAEDSLVDVINYMVLTAGMLRQRTTNPVTTTTAPLPDMHRSPHPPYAMPSEWVASLTPSQRHAMRVALGANGEVEHLPPATPAPIPNTPPQPIMGVDLSRPTRGVPISSRPPVPFGYSAGDAKASPPPPPDPNIPTPADVASLEIPDGAYIPVPTSDVLSGWEDAL